jgi:hypothetical protein
MGPQNLDRMTILHWSNSHTSIEMAKKENVYYMPNKLTKWNPMAKNGNPTQSFEVNKLYQKHKK